LEKKGEITVAKKHKKHIFVLNIPPKRCIIKRRNL